MCADFCYKMLHCGIFVRCILRFVRWVYCLTFFVVDFHFAKCENGRLVFGVDVNHQDAHDHGVIAGVILTGQGHRTHVEVADDHFGGGEVVCRQSRMRLSDITSTQYIEIVQPLRWWKKKRDWERGLVLLRYDTITRLLANGGSISLKAVSTAIGWK